MGERNKGHELRYIRCWQDGDDRPKFWPACAGDRTHARTHGARRTQDARRSPRMHKTRKMISILNGGVAWTHIC